MWAACRGFWPYPALSSSLPVFPAPEGCSPWRRVCCAAGLRAFAAVGYYNATKFAVEGLSEALWQEVEPLGIKVMVVEPSGFRTDFAGRSANESAQVIADYAATAGARRQQLRASSGKQPEVYLLDCVYLYFQK